MIKIEPLVLGPKYSMQEALNDYVGSIKKAISIANLIYDTEVTNYLNNEPGFRVTTTKEQRAVYLLARAYDSLRIAMLAARTTKEDQT